MTYELASQQVSWADVHEFVLPKLTSVGDWPMVGSPAWCELPTRDRIKWASLLDAAQHWALRLECLQQAECEASHAISAAADWSALTRAMQGRNDCLAARGEPLEYFTPRPWLDRRAVR